MNFLVFAEDPVSHSRRGNTYTFEKMNYSTYQIFFSITEADIPVVGQVFSFVITKYPLDWRYCFLKVLYVFYCTLVNCIVFSIVIAGIHTIMY